MGFLDGFFGSFLAEVEIDDTGEVYQVNLFKCITEHQLTFQVAWNTSSHLLATLANNLDKVDEAFWQQGLFEALLVFPRAFAQCTGGEKGGMLIQSMEALDNVHIFFSEPSRTNMTMQERCVSCVEQWVEEEWSELGSCIGKLVRDWLLFTFPELYDVDARGVLVTRRVLPWRAFGAAGAAGLLLVCVSLRIRRYRWHVSHRLLNMEGDGVEVE